MRSQRGECTSPAPVRCRQRVGWGGRSGPIAMVCLAAAFAAAPARAQDSGATEPLDLTFERPGDPDTWIRPNARIATAWFAGFGAWGGRTASNIGDNTNGWAEIGVVPGVDAQVSLGDAGTLSGRLSGVFTTTQLGLDFAGSNYIDGETQSVHDFTLEDFYLRWSSGKLVSSLGEDAIELSVGSQTYEAGPDLGPGFLFYGGGADGGKRGGYWLGLRSAFQLTGMARLRTANAFAEAVFLRSDDLGGDHTNIVGANSYYDFAERTGLPLLRLGVGYWNVVHSDSAARDGLNVIDARLDVKPLSSGAPGLRFTGEMVKQKNGTRNDSWGAWAELGYDFAADGVTGSPYLSYRYAYFAGTGRNESFDPLFYGFSDWNYWYLGEISGEWVTGNGNLQASILRVSASPTESITANLFWIYQHLGEHMDEVQAPRGRSVERRPLRITDKNLSHEVDFIVDWSVNDYLTTSFVAAVLVPLGGGEQYFGGDDVWGQFMLYTSLAF